MSDRPKRLLSLVARLVGPASPAPPVRVLAADRATTAILFAVFLTMTAFVSLAVYIGFHFVAPRLGGGATGRPQACREDLAGQCGEGEMCVEGECVPDASAAACAEGAACAACTCIYPMTCGEDEVCRAREQTTTCSPGAAEFVREMLAYQVQCVSHAGGVELSNCPTNNVKDFLLSHEKFDALLQEFSTSLVFLFPEGRPEIATLGAQYGGPTWPDEPTRAYYRAAVAGKLPALAAAKHVVIVGRASKGNTAMSFAFAQARIRFARNTLLDSLAASPLERGEIAKKFIEFALGAERPLNLEFFLLGQQPAILWNDAASRDLSRVFADMRANNVVSRERRRAAEELINRSVAIFAIPPECMGGTP